MTKDRRLIVAATAFLDSGGEGAVTSGRSAMLPESLTMLQHFESRMRDRQSQHQIHFEVPQ